MSGRRGRRLLFRRLPLPWVIAWRYLRGRRSRLLTSTARAALAATGLGVTAMVVAMALMTGYTEDLEAKLIGLQAEVIISPLADRTLADGAAALAQVAALPEVEGVARVAFGEGSLASPGVPGGIAVTLRGVDPGAPARLVATAALEPGAPGELPPVLLGVELARQLEVAVGEALRLVVLAPEGRRPSFHYRSVRLAGTFTTGFAEFDSRWVVIERRELEQLRGRAGLDFVEVQLVDPATTADAAARIQEIVGPDFLVSSWRGLNRELFTALRIQQALLFLVIGLIVLVSTFNVASTLLVLVRERMRDVGVLGSLGLTPRALWWAFASYGLLLGAVGTGLGVAAGWGISWLLTTFEVVRFGPEVAAIYFIDSVPFRVEGIDVTAVVVFSLAVTLAACSLPALRAARIEPATALRYE